MPPDVLAPVMKQLVDGFISDRTRPEAMAVGLKTVRELAARSPLLMTPDLLQVRLQSSCVWLRTVNCDPASGCGESSGLVM